MPITIRKRAQGSGGWEADIMITTTDGTKIRKRLKSPLSSKSATLRWAEEKARHLAMHGDVKPSAPPKKETPTLAAFVPEFLAYQATVNKPSEMRAKNTIITHHLLPALGTMRLTAIDARAIDRYRVAKLSQDRQHGPGKLTPKTVSNHLNVLARILRVAHKWGIIERVPDIERPSVPEQAFVFLDIEQAELYLRTAAEHAPEWRTFLLVAMRTGLRVGELLALRWRHVDLARRSLRVEESHTPEGGFASTKNSRIRDVALAVDAAEALRELVAEPDTLVFPHHDGGPMSRANITHNVDRVARLSGLPGLHPHALRHTFASHCVMHGVPLRQVQIWMGHADISMTCRYAHLSPEFGAEMIDRLAGRGAVVEQPAKGSSRKPKKP